MNITIAVAQTDADIDRCYPAMAQLRPHVQRDSFNAQVRRQMAAGYQLVYLSKEGDIKAVAGFRLSENLFLSKHLYVDDLVTDAAARSQGFGKRLFDWLLAFGQANGCTHLELDSGVQRFGAHRFYLREGMEIRSHHFSLLLTDQ